MSGGSHQENTIRVQSVSLFELTVLLEYPRDSGHVVHLPGVSQVERWYNIRRRGRGAGESIGRKGRKEGREAG